VGSEGISAKSIVQSYEYLGVPLSAKGATPLSADKLQKYLDNLSRAPQKPQQRLYILKRHVIPALYHQLVLSDCSKRLFTFLDVKIRGAVKIWLKMAKNTSNFYIHALVNEGDLMATAVRMARGRPERDVACDACGRTESMGHILQLCPRTNGARNDRQFRA
jgi:hypothetical protein